MVSSTFRVSLFQITLDNPSQMAQSLVSCVILDRVHSQSYTIHKNKSGFMLFTVLEISFYWWSGVLNSTQCVEKLTLW